VVTNNGSVTDRHGIAGLIDPRVLGLSRVLERGSHCVMRCTMPVVPLSPPVVLPRT
jgi:hypothetical protein